MVDNVMQANGATVKTTTYTNGSTDVTTYDPDTGITTDAITNSNGSSGTTFSNGLTGEHGYTSVSADGSDHESSDTVYLANGAVETKTSSLDASGNGIRYDSVQYLDGGYEQQWRKTDGTSGSTATGVADSAGDTFTWGPGLQSSTVETLSGNDQLLIQGGVAPDQLWFSQDGTDLDISILGTSNRLDVQGWFASPGNQLSSIALSDGERLAGADVQKLVEAMASFEVPGAAQLQYTPSENATIQPVLVANWH
jgi:hypothetical protein